MPKRYEQLFYLGVNTHIFVCPWVFQGRLISIFQETMSNLMRTVECVRTYIDDLLVTTMSMHDNDLNKIEALLDRLRRVKLRLNIKKSSFALYEIQYLGYVLSREGIKP